MSALARVSPRVVALALLGYGLFAAVVSVWFTTVTGRSLWSLQADPTATPVYIVAMNLVLWGSWGIFAPGVFALARRFPFGRHTWRQALAVHLPAALIVTVAHVTLVAAGRFALQRSVGVPADWFATHVDALFRTLDFELPVYWAFVGLQHSTSYYREVQQREVRAAQLETRLIEAQLDALHRQLHPHFLFNTLHAITSLVHREPDKAEEMIQRLSDLLRITLRRSAAQEVPLAEELAYLRAYLDIEQVHFGDRLKVAYRVDPGALEALVPSLILQPLAENALRHGLERQTGSGRLDIEARIEDGDIVLVVADNGRGMAGHAVHEGVGLANTRARLDRLHRGGASLRVTPGADGGVRSTVRIPLRPAGVAGRGQVPA